MTEALVVGAICTLLGLLGGWAGSATLFGWRLHGRVCSLETRVEGIDTTVNGISETTGEINGKLENLCGRIGVS